MAARVRHAPSTAPALVVIASPGTLIALNTGADPRLIDLLWDRVSSGADFESLVGVMPAESAGRPLSFVLIGDIVEGGEGASLQALVNGPRGFDVATAGTPQHIAPSASSPWLRTRLQHVTHVAIGTDAATRQLPLDAGVVATSRVDMAIGDAAAPAASDEVSTDHAVGTALLDAHADAHDGQTVTRAPGHVEMTGDIRLADVPRTPRTVMFGYRVNGGQAFSLDLPHRYGRSPRAGTGGEARLVPLLSPTKTVSATHLDVRQIGDTVVVTDLGSTNGTSIIEPGQQWRRMGSGESLAVAAGTFIDLGDGNVIEIMPGVPLG